MSKNVARILGIGLLSLLKNIIVTLCVLAPGALLMVMGRHDAGTIVLLSCAFALFAVCYLRSWRAAVVSTLLLLLVPALAMGGQVYLFRDALPPEWTLATAAGGGALLGCVLGILHRLGPGDRFFMAGSAFPHLLAWFLAVGSVQGLAHFGAELRYLHGALLAAAATTALLALFALVLLARLALQSRKLGKLTALLALGAVVAPALPTPSRADSIDGERFQALIAEAVDPARFVYRGKRAVPAPTVASPERGETVRADYSVSFSNPGEDESAPQNEVMVTVEAWIAESPAAARTITRFVRAEEKRTLHEGVGNDDAQTRPLSIENADSSGGFLYQHRDPSAGGARGDYAHLTATSGPVVVNVRTIVIDNPTVLDPAWAPALCTELAAALLPKVRDRGTSPTPAPAPAPAPATDAPPPLPAPDAEEPAATPPATTAARSEESGAADGSSESANGGSDTEAAETETSGDTFVLPASWRGWDWHWPESWKVPDEWTLPRHPFLQATLVLAGILALGGIGSGLGQALARVRHFPAEGVEAARATPSADATAEDEVDLAPDEDLGTAALFSESGEPALAHLADLKDALRQHLGALPDAPPVLSGAPWKGSLPTDHLPLEAHRALAELSRNGPSNEGGPTWWKTGTTVLADALATAGMKATPEGIARGVALCDVHKNADGKAFQAITPGPVASAPSSTPVRRPIDAPPGRPPSPPSGEGGSE